MTDQECPKCEEGLPPWLATFADLMSLLMCFFVLLLSFAELDAIRFKKMADSMKDAFGVQTEVPAIEIVKGISVIKTEFSPSIITNPTVTDDVRQTTTEAEKEFLDVPGGEGTKSDTAGGADIDADLAAQVAADQIAQEVAQQAEELKEMLQLEIEESLVTVESEAAKIIIRINEKGSFASGSADFNYGFADVMVRISEAVARAPGSVVVAGHTDDIPISTARFRSNWELSSARAVSVVHELLKEPAMDPRRVRIEGHADSKPILPNDTSENRAINRRVELVIERGQDIDEGALLPITLPEESGPLPIEQE